MQHILCRAPRARTGCSHGLKVLESQCQHRQLRATTLRQFTSKPTKQKSEELLAKLFPEEYAAKKSKEENERRLQQLKGLVSIERPKRQPKVNSAVKLAIEPIIETASKLAIEPAVEAAKPVPQPVPQRHEDEPNEKSKLDIDRTKWEKKQEVQGPKGFLRLDSASVNLVPEDFYRLMPQSKHLEGWHLRMGAIEKIVPGRDLDTLQRTDHYYLVFQSVRSAMEYRDRAHRIAKLYDICGPFAHVSDKPITKDLLLPGENPDQLAKLYTLGPHGKALDLRVMKAHHPKYMEHDGGYSAILKRPWRSPAEVIIRAGLSHLSFHPLRSAFGKAELRRNMPWTGDEFGAFKLYLWNPRWRSKKVQEARNKPNKDTKGQPVPIDEREAGNDEDGEKHGPKRPQTFLVGLQSMEDAEAFARYWHRRELVNHKADSSAPPVVLDAEVLC
ncbi:hypothetical protein KVT40_005328 [Elsinoe batatas]|uniref:Uncharacterized protein n=1 Tax=Elsinoe batatas TaxID=2601811 RepID=A0A8K0PGH8_9PEZI|nr:hypothetical protein KVT40_005328 [Elsinoe batatas]